ncbi:MAG: phosphatase PAP2 family protein [Actinomycetota bacterium]|nr:phosphatase PAP2 family protein [Actinomycetota bacterium]
MRIHIRALAPGVRRFDAYVDRRFDRLRGVRAADRLLYTASELGDFSLLWHLVGWSAAPFSDRRRREAIELSATLGVESAIVNQGIKRLFSRQRPVWEQERPRRLRQPKTTSFPSGHASSAFTAAAVLSRSWPRPLVYGLAVIVSASRVHVRIHHASDVVGGAIVGVALGAIARRVIDAVDTGGDAA